MRRRAGGPGIARVGGVIHFPERNAALRGDPGTIVILGAERRRALAQPTEFSPDSTEPYGVGAFLLAGCEMARMETKQPAP